MKFVVICYYCRTLSDMKSKENTFKLLKEITSYYSFGRILGYLRFEMFGNPQKSSEKSFLPDSERLISSEIALLAGMWICNVNLSKNWSIEDDTHYLHETKKLIENLHLCYRPTINTSFNEQLKEVAFYEGDPGYAWQFVDFAQRKYRNDTFKDYLLAEHKFDVTILQKTYNKIINFIEQQFKERRNKKQKRFDYISPLNAFVISPKALHRNFNHLEQGIIKSLSIKLGDKQEQTINDIADRNIFSQYPIIELPYERGYFIIEPLSLSIAMNETPYYWILDSKRFNSKEIGKIRGDNAEDIVYEIINKKFLSDYISRNILICKTKSSNVITDIDLLIVYKDIYIVFQVKSKRLTELSKRGDWDSIEKDFNEAAVNAYNQGCKCIDCLKESYQYYSLKKRGIDATEKSTFFNICVTLDQYPTISSMTLYKSYDVETKNIPFMAMSIYDLELIFSLLSTSEIIDYFRFRKECAKNKIYGITEVYYLGAYIIERVYGEILFDEGYKINRSCAIFIDYIVDSCRYYNIKIESLKDIDELLYRYPFSLGDRDGCSGQGR